MSIIGVACVAAAVVVLSGCGTGGFSDEGNQSAGRDLFIGRCGGCHVLAEAGTAGTIGPNLDDAFAQAREDGMTTSTFTNVVVDQILFPITNTSTGAPGMPGPDETLPECDDVEGEGFCVEDQHQAAADIGAYVGRVAGTGATTEKPTDGKSIFTSTCGSCHTLADAGHERDRRPEPRRREAAEGARGRPRDEREGRDAVVQGNARPAADRGRGRLRVVVGRQVASGRRSGYVTGCGSSRASRSTMTCVTRMS